MISDEEDSRIKKTGGRNEFSSRVEVMSWSYEIISQLVTGLLWKLMFLFLRGGLFLGRGFLCFFLCHETIPPFRSA